MSTPSDTVLGENRVTVVCLKDLPRNLSHKRSDDKKESTGDFWRTSILSAKNQAHGLAFATSRIFSEHGRFRSQPIHVLKKSVTHFVSNNPVSVSLQRCAHSLIHCTHTCDLLLRSARTYIHHSAALLTPDRISSLLSNVTRARRADHARLALASLSSSFWTAPSTEDLASGEQVGKHLFDLALSGPQVAKSMDRVPVYTVSNSSNEFILISDLGSLKSLGLFCFRQQDADALLAQVKDREPSLGRGARVVQVMLDKVYQLSAEGIAFRFLPDPQQVRHALEEKGRKGPTVTDRGFDGIPVFQSGNLILKSRNRRFLPVFFSKEDLDLALRKAFQQQKRSNPALKVNTDIQVASFEEILKQMESQGEDKGWGDIVFIPPGTDVNTHLDTAIAIAGGSASSAMC